MSKENLVDLILNNYDEFVLQHEANSDMDISEADFSHTNIEKITFLRYNRKEWFFKEMGQCTRKKPSHGF